MTDDVLDDCALFLVLRRLRYAFVLFGKITLISVAEFSWYEQYGAHSSLFLTHTHSRYANKGAPTHNFRLCFVDYYSLCTKKRHILYHHIKSLFGQPQTTTSKLFYNDDAIYDDDDSFYSCGCLRYQCYGGDGSGSGRHVYG